MKKRVVIAFFATSLTAGTPFAPDWPLMGPQLYPSAPRMAVDWTGIYFGANALRLGAGLIKYQSWRWSDKYSWGGRIGNSGWRDDATWPRRVGARWYEPVELKQSARRHCWRSNRLQLASRNGRLRSRA